MGSGTRAVSYQTVYPVHMLDDEQRRVWDCHRSNPAWDYDKVGKDLGLSRISVGKILTQARDLMGLDPAMLARKPSKARERKINKMIAKETLATVASNVALRMVKSLEDLTDAEVAKIQPQSRAIIFGILVEKRQLLMGEPTQITANMKDQGRLGEVAEGLLREIQRRGLAMDVDFKSKDTTPTSLPDVINQSKSPE